MQRVGATCAVQAARAMPRDNQKLHSIISLEAPRCPFLVGVVYGGFGAMI